MTKADGIVELNVRLVAGSNPLRGSLRLTQGEAREFWGWLELAELIQQASDSEGRGDALTTDTLWPGDFTGREPSGGDSHVHARR